MVQNLSVGTLLGINEACAVLTVPSYLVQTLRLEATVVEEEDGDTIATRSLDVARDWVQRQGTTCSPWYEQPAAVQGQERVTRSAVGDEVELVGIERAGPPTS